MKKNCLVFMIFLCLIFVPPADASAGKGLLAVSPGISPCIEEILDSFEASGRGSLVLVKETTGILARQIDSGAPYDLLIAADPEWPDWLISRGNGTSSRICAWNRLSIWSERPADENDLSALVIAIPNPDFTSYGKKAMEFLTQMGLWEKGIENGQVLICGSAPQCVATVRAGTAQVALIPLPTANMAGGHSRVIDRVDPLPVVVLLVNEDPPKEILEFRSFLFGREASKIWSKWGFETFSGGAVH